MKLMIIEIYKDIFLGDIFLIRESKNQGVYGSWKCPANVFYSGICPGIFNFVGFILEMS